MNTDVTEIFTVHKLNDVGFETVGGFKEDLALLVNKHMTDMPNGREKSLFLTKMEEASFYGTKAIASKPHFHESKTRYMPEPYTEKGI